MFRHVLRRHSSTLTERKLTFPKPPPAPPPTSPTVYITEDEFVNYVKPLYRYRWSVVHFHRNFYLTADGELRSGVFSAPYLRRTFHFRRAVDTKGFLQDLTEMVTSDRDGEVKQQQQQQQEQQQHEPFVAIRPFGTSKEAYRVAVFSGTHRCHDAPSLLSSEGTRVGPGISVHDVRFAIAVEDIFTEYVRSGFGFDAKWKYPRVPLNVARIKERQRQADEWLIRSEQRSYDTVVTPGLEGVAPLPIPEVPLEEGVGDELCTDEEFGRVIRPLYTRGWYVVYNNVTREGGDGRVVLEKQPVLNGFFRFRSFGAAMGFCQDVLILAQTEEVGAMLWVDAQTVTVQGPAWERGWGVTKREARFAVLVEELFVKQYGKSARRSAVVGMKLLSQPESVEELMRHPAAKMVKARYNKVKWERIVRATQRVVGGRDKTADGVTAAD